MMILHRVAKVPHVPLVRQFAKFVIVGLINTGTHATVYIIASRGFHLRPLTANVAAFFVAVTVSFILNRRWTFRSTHLPYRQQYTKFFAVSLAGFGWSELLLYIGHYRLGLNDLLALAISIVIVLFWNFTLNKLWTFRGASPDLAAKP